MMKAVVISLLAAALLFGTAHSLKCYVCAAASGSCNTQTTCGGSADKYCATLAATSGSSTVVTNFCAITCNPGTTTLGGATSRLSCCQTDLCNGATSMKISYTMLFFAAGISALFLKGGL
ncbi:uncharacterized protein LOC144826922 [Lissotriton helveticus]